MEAGTKECAWRAREWCSFLEAHARRIYAIGEQAHIKAAHALAKRIQKHQITDGTTVRSIYRKCWADLRDKAVVEAGLFVLEDAGWCRIVEEKGALGRGSEIVRLHPELTREVRE